MSICLITSLDDRGTLEIAQDIAKAQAKKIFDVLWEDCVEHGNTDPPLKRSQFYRAWCDECHKQFKKEIE